MRPRPFTLLALLACGLMACSRSQKSGTAISAQAIARAMPEFSLVLPPGATNVYFEQRPGPRLTTVFLKLTLPRSSLTNFLTLSGLNAGFFSLPAGAGFPPTIPLPGGLDAGSAADWLSDARHANEWDLGKEQIPMLMSVFRTSAKSSPAEQVLVMVEVDDSTSPQAKVYLMYIRCPKTLHR